MVLNSLEPVNYPDPTDSTDTKLQSLVQTRDETSINPSQQNATTHEPHFSIQPKKRQGITKWLIGISLFLLAGVGYLAYQQLVKQQQQANERMAAVPLERTNFSITVSANGTTQPEHVINVSPKTAGIMTSLLVKEGDSVSKGQVVAHMDDSNLRGQLTQEQGRLTKAEANLRKLIAGNRPQDIAQAQARLDSAQASLRKADDDFRRNQKLHDVGAISLQALNQKRADRDSAQAQVAAAKQALSLQKAGTRIEDIDQARAEVRSARGSLQNIQTQIDDTLIRAPFTGVVNRKYADPGAFVTPMTAGSSVSSATSSSILALTSTNQVVANVAESSISQIHLGQQVLIKANAYPGKTFWGRVSQIATQATVEQNVTSFEVKVAILSDSEKLLRSGMNVSVEFKVGQLQNALTVPTVAVTRQQNVTGVFVACPDQPPVFTPIATGATVNNRTEVKAGLNGTEQVLIGLPPKPQKSGISFPGLPGSSKADGSQGGPPGGPPPGGGPPAH